MALVLAVVLAGVWPGTAAAITGNIHPAALEIDSSANLYPGSGNCTTSSFAAIADWVTDCAANTDPASLVDSVATGLIPGVTSREDGTGHWAGVRIVDGIAGGDQDIFLSGGKENDTSTWTVGPGPVGAAKYDATQAYLANNQTDLFFGMERRGNNGTTAFDFEFNQSGAAGGYIPNRTNGDVLLSFEMQGSGASGSATPHYFIWSASLSKYVEQDSLPTGTLSTINTTATTPPGPWGRVDKSGDWVGTNFEKFEFAEARVPLSILPGVDNCGGRAFVQLRTRSSATDRSDLKDTTKIFEFLFGSPEAAAALSTNCLAQFTYDGAGSKNASGGTTGLTYSWAISVVPTTATLSGGGVSATATPGLYTSTQQSGTVSVNFPADAAVTSAVITVNNTIADGACNDDSGNRIVTVYRILGATATLTPKCNNTFDFAGTATGGRAPYAFAWTFQRNSLPDATGTWSTIATSSLVSGTVNAGVQGAYRAVLTVTDSAGTDSGPGILPKPQCQVQVTSNTVNVYDAVGGSVSLTPDCDNTFAYSASGTGGLAPYTFAYTLEKLNVATSTWETAKTFNDGPIPGPSTGVLDINDATFLKSGEGRYRLKVTITDSQGIVCTLNATSNEVDIRNPLTASAAKTGANGSTLVVTLTGSSASGTSLQWQRFNGTSWVNLAGETATTLNYSSFESDATPVLTGAFTIGSGPGAGAYVGKVWSVTFRLRAQRTLNGILCEAFSSVVEVKKVTAVDP